MMENSDEDTVIGTPTGSPRCRGQDLRALIPAMEANVPTRELGQARNDGQSGTDDWMNISTPEGGDDQEIRIRRPDINPDHKGEPIDPSWTVGAMPKMDFESSPVRRRWSPTARVAGVAACTRQGPLTSEPSE